VKNATVARIQEFAHSKLASVTITEKYIKFNADSVAFLPGATFVEILFHPLERILAVRRTDSENKNAVLWDGKPISAGNLCKCIYTILGWDRRISYKVMADFFMRADGRILMYDLGSAEFYMKESVERWMADGDGKQVSVWKEVSKLLQPERWADDFGRDVISHATMCRHWLARSLDAWLLDAPAENVPGFDNYESILTDKELICQADADQRESFGAYLTADQSNENEVNGDG